MIEYPSAEWKDYELLDSGAGEKLERFGPYVIIRPEPKALWDKSMNEADWARLAHTRFVPGAGFGKAGKEDSGTWQRLKRSEDRWYIRYGATPDGPRFSLRLGLTSFKHVGVFPEQAPNWEFIYRSVKEMAGGGAETGAADGAEAAVGGAKARGAAGAAASSESAAPARRPRVLNLFAYTGAASLAAKAAGADVTHLDSVKQVVTWARDNMEQSNLDGIRWLVEDALKFVRREQRRGHVYDGIIMDPPAYGHGPDGEKWKLDECLFEMMKSVNEILSPRNSFLVLNLYSNGFSPLMGETVARQALGKAGTLESGELALLDRFGKALPLSVVVRVKR